MPGEEEENNEVRELELTAEMLAEYVETINAARAERLEEMSRPAQPVDAADVVLGREYTDCITGVTGTATIVHVHLTGCDQVTLLYMAKDSLPANLTVDASRLIELEPAEEPAHGACEGPTGRV